MDDPREFVVSYPLWFLFRKEPPDLAVYRTGKGHVAALAFTDVDLAERYAAGDPGLSNYKPRALRSEAALADRAWALRLLGVTHVAVDPRPGPGREDVILVRLPDSSE